MKSYTIYIGFWKKFINELVLEILMKHRDMLILGFLILGSLVVLQYEDILLSGISRTSDVSLSPGGLNSLDNFESKLISVFVGKPSFLHEFMVFLDSSFNILALLLIGTIILTLFSLKDRKKLLFAFISSVLGASIVTFLLKLLFQRARPLLALVDYSSFSFPSGHATAIFATLPVFLKKYPKFKYLFYVIAAFVLYNRLFLGLHYFGDLIVGAIIGYSIGWFFVKYAKI